MRTNKWAALVVAVALGASACGGGSGEKVGAGTGSWEVVLDASSQPPDETRLLRISAQPGDVIVMTQVVDNDIGFGPADDGLPPLTDIPPVSMSSRLEVTDVIDGVIHVDFTYSDVEVLAGPEHDDRVVAAMRQSMAGFTQVGGTMQITEQGAVVDASFVGLDQLSDDVRPVVEQIRSSFETSVAPFPTEEVGVGSAWTSSTTMDIGDLSQKIVYRFEVVELRDDETVLDVAYTAEVLPSTIKAEDGSTADIVGGETSGTGRQFFPIAGIMPRRAQLTAGGTVEMDIPDLGLQTQRLQLSLELRTT